ncbi:MAG: HEAT repeat domain-containing protein [Pontiellaceae bacterium]|nr:HEAT repeat domain-containing protein [Pontiellaceae bacterium]
MKKVARQFIAAGLLLAATLGAQAESTVVCKVELDNACISKLVSNEVKVEILPLSTSALESLGSEDARERFLAVERFARLPKEEQSALLPDFFHQLAPRTLSRVVEMILSSAPHDILNRYQTNDTYDGNTDLWAQQLADASLTLSVEEVADKLETSLWLNVASRARALWIYEQYPERVAVLISADLDSNDPLAVERAAGVIQALNITDFSDRLLEIWIDGNQDQPSPIWSALIFMDHSGILSPLLKRVQEDPKFLIRCSGLFQGPLYGKPAEPFLLSLLDDADPEIRYAAAYALMECVDEQLAQPVEKMAVDPDARIRFIAAHQIPKLPPDAFQSVREQLMTLLNDPDEEVRFYALLGFGKRKDLAAGAVILEMLRQEQLDEQYKVWTMQALAALSGSTWDYDMHEWGPQRSGNQNAILRFKKWLDKQQANLTWQQTIDE